MSRTSVYKGLKELEAAGLLRTRKRRGRGGNHNVYTLHFWEPLNCTPDTPDKMSPLTKNRANIHNSDVQTSATETFQRPPRGREVYAVEEQAMKHTEQVKPDANFENREIRWDRANISASAPHECQSGFVFVTDKSGNQAVKPCPHCKAQREQSTTSTGANASAVSTSDFNFGQNFPDDLFGNFFDRKPEQQEALLPRIRGAAAHLGTRGEFREIGALGREKGTGRCDGRVVRAVLAGGRAVYEHSSYFPG